MPYSDLIRSKCPRCGKKIGVRADQLGRRVRCPACKFAFSVEAPAEPSSVAGPTLVTEDTPSGEGSAEWVQANDANELARAEHSRRDWPKAKVTAALKKLREPFHEIGEVVRVKGKAPRVVYE